jgi:hypothetical protein
VKPEAIRTWGRRRPLGSAPAAPVRRPDRRPHPRLRIAELLRACAGVHATLPASGLHLGQLGPVPSFDPPAFSALPTRLRPSASRRTSRRAGPARRRLIFKATGLSPMGDA